MTIHDHIRQEAAGNFWHPEEVDGGHSRGYTFHETLLELFGRMVVWNISVDMFIAATDTFSGMTMGILTNIEQQRGETILLSAVFPDAN